MIDNNELTVSDFFFNFCNIDTSSYNSYEDVLEKVKEFLTHLEELGLQKLPRSSDLANDFINRL